MPKLKKDKQEMFCQYYVQSYNQAEAARKAGYAAHSARITGCKLMQQPEIRARVQELNNETADELGLTRRRVMVQYSRVAFFDSRTLFDENNALKNISELDEDAGAAIMGVEIDELFEWIDGVKVKIGQTKKVKITERKPALDSICKMLGYNEAEKVDHTSKGESLNDAGIEKLSADERLVLLRLKQKMKGDEGNSVS